VARAIVWAGRARSDLRISAEYIRKASPTAARAFVSAVLQTARSLSESPERGRVVPDIDDPEVRELFVGRYRLLYEVHPEVVWVMRVLHSSRDLLLALGRRPREEAERDK
jgi:toxin ParE1/3/4